MILCKGGLFLGCNYQYRVFWNIVDQSLLVKDPIPDYDDINDSDDNHNNHKSLQEDYHKDNYK